MTIFHAQAHTNQKNTEFILLSSEGHVLLESPAMLVQPDAWIRAFAYMILPRDPAEIIRSLSVCLESRLSLQAASGIPSMRAGPKIVRGQV